MGVSTVAEFFGASCIMLVILWKEIETLLDTRGAPALLAGFTWGHRGVNRDVKRILALLRREMKAACSLRLAPWVCM